MFCKYEWGFIAVGRAFEFQPILAGGFIRVYLFIAYEMELSGHGEFIFMIMSHRCGIAAYF